MRHAVVLVVLGLVAGGTARGADPCDAFDWNVTAERTLFGQPGRDAAAATALTASPTLALSTLYRLALAPQGDVSFVQPPAKKTLADGAHGGLASFHLGAPGRYRVSLDAPAWIDVVAGDAIVPSRAFQGRPGCAAPHKIVEYELPAGDAVLQLSAAAADHVRVTITPSPPATM